MKIIATITAEELKEIVIRQLEQKGFGVVRTSFNAIFNDSKSKSEFKGVEVEIFEQIGKRT